MSFIISQGRRKHFKLGGARHFKGTFFITLKGHFLKIKRALLCLFQNLGGHVPPVPPRFLRLWGYLSILCSFIGSFVYKGWVFNFWLHSLLCPSSSNLPSQVTLACVPDHYEKVRHNLFFLESGTQGR